MHELPEARSTNDDGVPKPYSSVQRYGDTLAPGCQVTVSVETVRVAVRSIGWPVDPTTKFDVSVMAW